MLGDLTDVNLLSGREKDRIMEDKNREQLSEKELEITAGGSDPFNSAYAFYYNIFDNDGTILKKDCTSFNYFWSTLSEIREQVASFYSWPAESLHWCRRGTRIEYDYSKSAQDNGISKYETVDVYKY